jgi:hypothetical protein
MLVYGLGTNIIKTWDEMRKQFLEKYHDYYTNQGMREEMFKMKKMKDYLERFHYTAKRERESNLDLDTLKVIFLRGIRDKCIDVINLMGKGYISHLTYPKICDLCMHISLGKSKYGNGHRDVISRVKKSSKYGVSRA